MRLRESLLFKIGLVFVLAFMVVAIIKATEAKAQPVLHCNSAPFVGSWCDSDWQPDGSYLHCYSGWGTVDCSWVCALEGNPVNPPLAPSGPGSCGPRLGTAKY